MRNLNLFNMALDCGNQPAALQPDARDAESLISPADDESIHRASVGRLLHSSGKCVNQDLRIASGLPVIRPGSMPCAEILLTTGLPGVSGVSDVSEMRCGLNPSLLQAVE
jgi:hypothetical protein